MVRTEQKGGEGEGELALLGRGRMPTSPVLVRVLLRLGLRTRVGMDAAGPQASGCTEHTVAFSLHGP